MHRKVLDMPELWPHIQSKRSKHPRVIVPDPASAESLFSFVGWYKRHSRGRGHLARTSQHFNKGSCARSILVRWEDESKVNCERLWIRRHRRDGNRMSMVSRPKSGGGSVQPSNGRHRDNSSNRENILGTEESHSCGGAMRRRVVISIAFSGLKRTSAIGCNACRSVDLGVGMSFEGV